MEVSPKVFPFLSLSLPASSLTQTGQLGVLSVPFSRLSSAQDGTGAQPVEGCISKLLNPIAAVPHGKRSQSAVPCAIPSSGSLPCHLWALVSIGCRRSLLGILQEAKATGSSPSSCLKDVPSPAEK